MYDKNCDHCSLSKSRTQVVFGCGNASAKLLLIGEAPGEEEDKYGKPFWPQAKCGSKIDSILNYLEIKREDVYITNANLCRPPNNRTPNPEEIDACRKRLFDEIQKIRPQIIVCLGKTAYNSVFETDLKGRLKDLMFTSSKDVIVHSKFGSQIIVTYHPSYLIRRGKTATTEVLPQWEWIKNNLNT